MTSRVQELAPVRMREDPEGRGSDTKLVTEICG